MSDFKASEIILSQTSTTKSVPVWAVAGANDPNAPQLDPIQKAWIEATGFKGQAKRVQLVPGADGTLQMVLFGLGEAKSGDPGGPPSMLAGTLASSLPGGTYQFAGQLADDELAAIAFGLGAYKFRHYKSPAKINELPRMEVSAPLDSNRIRAIVDAVWLARDLINTPAGDMGPAELEAAVRMVAESHGVAVRSVVGDKLLEENFPLIHAVGRASTRSPRLIDFNWGPENAPKVTLVGKGICFDTGGLDLKPSSAMLNMKKDMGGAATVLALASMIMALNVQVRLRVLLPTAENSVSGNAFRPRDVIKSRAGTTVEIGNTDAEGRLVLADALALADEEKPDLMLSFATLTGAARVAMGPDVVPFFCDDDALAARIGQAGGRVGDPLWRMPFWNGYDAALESDVADINNIADANPAGAIIAALFLRRFVRNAARYAHFDIFGWIPSAKPIGPKGGEAQAARAMLEVISEIAGESVSNVERE